MEITIFDGRLPRVANILFFQHEIVNGWMEVERQGRRWFLGIIIAHLPEILSVKFGYLEIIFPVIQVDLSDEILSAY